MQTIVVIDGMGGGIGAQIIERLRKETIRDATIVALGANAAATQRMIAAGASKGATGENAIRFSVRTADFILGPIGIVLANSMMGEITPEMARAVTSAPCLKLLLPLSQSQIVIAGTVQKNVNDLICDLVAELKNALRPQP
jgi:hypothetical protein